MNKVKHTNANWLDQFIKKLKTMGEKEVAVGYPAHKGLDTPYYKTGASVIDVAVWNNYGTKRIPARPFFDLASVKIQRQIKARAQADIKLCLQGKLPLSVMLNRWGVEAKGIIQEQIGNTGPPNKQSTFNKKTAKLRKKNVREYGEAIGSLMKVEAMALIDTGHMQQSTTYVIRKRTV